jgi:hypothetical protein
MKTDNQNSGNGNRQKENVKQQNNVNKNMDPKKERKQVYIKDMPPIDGAKPGVM